MNEHRQNLVSMMIKLYGSNDPDVINFQRWAMILPESEYYDLLLSSIANASKMFPKLTFKIEKTY